MGDVEAEMALHDNVESLSLSIKRAVEERAQLKAENERLRARLDEIHARWCYKTHATDAERDKCFDEHIGTCLQIASDNGNRCRDLEGAIGRCVIRKGQRCLARDVLKNA